MRRILIASPVLLLTLTAAQCQHTEPGIEVRTVEVPVPMPCMSAEQIAANPEPPLVGDQLTGDAVHDLPIVAASALRLRAWGRTGWTAHAACADTTNTVSE